MKALILAAGYATRLYPLTKEYPKSLLPVKQRAIIDFIIDKLSALEAIDEIIIVTNSKFISPFKKWLKKQTTEKRISLVDDLTKDNASRRGAIGDLDFVINKKRLRDDLLVIGGDNLFEDDLSEFLRFAQAQKKNPVIGVHRLKDKAHASKYGVLELDKKNKVIDFQEKPAKPQSRLVAMCLYFFPKERLGLVKEYVKSKTRKKADAVGFYIDWLSRKVTVYAYVFGGRWYDIGDHKFYNKARKTFIT
ncbi:MAG: nucleotidyltransferase family protein [Candidatus Omnitrophota bacterium]